MQKIDSYIPNGGGFQKPDLLVIHAMGEFIKSERIGYPSQHAVPFLNENGYSAHLLISPEGDVYKCHPFDHVAYHAKGYNLNSIGIEFLVPGKHDYSSFLAAIKTDWVSEEQYQSGLAEIKAILHDYPITRIVKHSDISPGRKYDPGEGFPWERLLNDLGML
jgi:AmpD protein